MIAQPRSNSLIQAFRQCLRCRHRLLDALRGIADDLDVDGFALFQLRDGIDENGLRACQFRFRLADIGACALAHIQPRLGGAQLFPEKGQVLLSDRHDPLIAGNVGIGLRGGEKDGNLVRLQRFAA